MNIWGDCMKRLSRGHPWIWQIICLGLLIHLDYIWPKFVVQAWGSFTWPIPTHLYTYACPAIHFCQTFLPRSGVGKWVRQSADTPSFNLQIYNSVGVFKSASSNRHSWRESVTESAWEIPKSKNKASQIDVVGLLFMHACQQLVALVMNWKPSSVALQWISTLIWICGIHVLSLLFFNRTTSVIKVTAVLRKYILV